MKTTLIRATNSGPGGELMTSAIAPRDPRDIANDALHQGAAEMPTIRRLCDSLALDALQLMGKLMHDKKQGEAVNRAAARDILYVWSRMPPATANEADALTPTEALAQARASLANPPPELAAVLAELGYERGER